MGGGLVEGHPDPAGSVPAGSLFNGALSTFERLGFERDRMIGRHRRVVTATVAPRGQLEPPPERLGVTHWSTRLLAGELGVGDATVARAWRRYHIQPWRQGTFRFSTDPELEAKVRDVVGLYLDPPKKAIVLCVDEKSQLQALDRTQPILPLRPGSRSIPG